MKPLKKFEINLCYNQNNDMCHNTINVYNFYNLQKLRESVLTKWW